MELLKKIPRGLHHGNEVIITFKNPYHWKKMDGKIHILPPFMKHWAEKEEGWIKCMILKAVFHHGNSGYELYATPLRPFRIGAEEIEYAKPHIKLFEMTIRFEDVLTITQITSGIHYTEIKPDLYVSEVWGHRVIISGDRLEDKWSYKIEKSVSCSWSFVASEKNIKTLKLAMDLVFLKIYGWLSKYEKIKPIRNSINSYCQG